MRKRAGGIHCEPVEMPDGTVAYVRKRRGVELAERDKAALMAFYESLKKKDGEDDEKS
jgi:hypothetical protein